LQPGCGNDMADTKTTCTYDNTYWQNYLQRLQANPTQYDETKILKMFEETLGYYHGLYLRRINAQGNNSTLIDLLNQSIKEFY
jgi:hypothetical protein